MAVWFRDVPCPLTCVTGVTGVDSAARVGACLREDDVGQDGLGGSVGARPQHGDVGFRLPVLGQQAVGFLPRVGELGVAEAGQDRAVEERRSADLVPGQNLFVVGDAVSVPKVGAGLVTDSAKLTEH